MSKYCLNICLSLVIFAVGLSQAGELVFQSDLDMGEEFGDYLIGSVSSVVEDSAGQIFVADRQQACILKFDAEGNYLERYESEGDGPGDLMQIFVLGMNQRDQLFVLGLGGRVEVLDTDWNYLHSFERKNPGGIADGIAFDGGGSVYVAAVNLGQHTTVDRFDEAFVYQVSFSETFAVGRDLPYGMEQTYSGGKVAPLPGGGVVYLQKAPYELRVFDSSGTLVASTSKGCQEFVPSPPRPEVDGDRVTFRMPGSATGVAVGEGGGILTSSFRRDEDNVITSRFCFYDKELKLLGTMEKNTFWSVNGVSRNGRFFVFGRSDDGNAISRVEVLVVND